MVLLQAVCRLTLTALLAVGIVVILVTVTL
jgi:hypothetical protein